MIELHKGECFRTVPNSGDPVPVPEAIERAVAELRARTYRAFAVGDTPVQGTNLHAVYTLDFPLPDRYVDTGSTTASEGSPTCLFGFRVPANYPTQRLRTPSFWRQSRFDSGSLTPSVNRLISTGPGSAQEYSRVITRRPKRLSFLLAPVGGSQAVESPHQQPRGPLHALPSAVRGARARLNAFEEDTRKPSWVPGAIAQEVPRRVPGRLVDLPQQSAMGRRPQRGMHVSHHEAEPREAPTTVLLNHPIWPEPGEVEASPESLELSSNYISRAIDAAINAGPLTGLALVHTHPDGALTHGVGRFSPRDDWYDHRLFATVMLARRSGLGASIVLARNAAELHARIFWWDNSKLSSQDGHVLRVVGPRLSILETPASEWTDHPDPAVFDRSVRVFGRQGQRLLQNVRVGIVGVGGTGSICLAALSTMGIGRIRCWDEDLVERTNRPRLLGSSERGHRSTQDRGLG